MILDIGYTSTKIFQNEKAYLKSKKGIASFTDTGLIYLDDVKKQIQAASKDSNIKDLTKNVKEKGDSVITQLVVNYKGDLPTIPADLREKLKVNPVDG